MSQDCGRRIQRKYELSWGSKYKIQTTFLTPISSIHHLIIIIIIHIIIIIYVLGMLSVCLFGLDVPLSSLTSLLQCLPLQASAGGAVAARRECRLLHHAPPRPPQGSPGLTGRLDPHESHPQPAAHARHRRPAPAQAAMTTAHFPPVHTQTPHQ